MDEMIELSWILSVVITFYQHKHMFCLNNILAHVYACRTRIKIKQVSHFTIKYFVTVGKLVTTVGKKLHSYRPE